LPDEQVVPVGYCLRINRELARVFVTQPAVRFFKVVKDTVLNADSLIYGRRRHIRPDCHSKYQDKDHYKAYAE
jgi:hypothetical protein